MSYGVRWAPEADEDLNRIASEDPVAASFILDRIDELARDPVNLSQPPSFPHRLIPKFQFWAPAVGIRLHVTVLFRYSVDEKFIEIIGIGTVKYDDPPPKGE